MSTVKTIQINFTDADEITKNISTLKETKIASLSVDELKKYSQRSCDKATEVNDAAKKIQSNLEDVYNSYSKTIQFWREKLQELSITIDDRLGRYEIDGDKYNEIMGITEFNFEYKKAAGTLNIVSEDKVREILVKNGATLTGENTYIMTIDGTEYRYNVHTGKLYISGQTDQYVTCKFYTTGKDVDFTKIKNTITYMGGSGELRNGYNPVDIESLNINDGSLVNIIRDGDGKKSIRYRTKEVAGATRVSNYLINGRTRTGYVYNSICGTSEGAIASIMAINENKGLYKTVVISNGNYQTIDADSFKDVEVIMLESKGNVTNGKHDFNKEVPSTLQDLKNAGAKVTLLTNDTELRDSATSVIGSENVLFKDDQSLDSKGKWVKHGDGFSMIKDMNVFSFLSSKENMI